MNTYIKQLVAVASLYICSSISYSVQAETSSVTDGPGDNMTSSVRLKLRVIIPRFLQFQVGNAGASVDTISFQPTADTVGNGVAVPGTGGNASGGSGTSVVLRSNAGQIAIVADNDGGSGGLGSSGAISLSEITAHSDSSDLQTPQLSDGGATTTTATLTDGDITDRRATWSYAYKNSHPVEPGSYDVEIVYTAVSP